MSTASRYDAVVVGGGHNGLTAAAYLARAGWSVLVLAGLEAEAAARGWTTLRLETGPRQPEAVRLYLSAGYRPIAAFGDYVGEADADDSLFFERVLPAG